MWAASITSCTKGPTRVSTRYSRFFDNHHLKKTEMEDILRAAGVTSIAVMGLATDYCVRFTVLDALQLGLDVEVVERGCRAVDLRPGDGSAAFEEMASRGARVVSAGSSHPEARISQ